MDKEDCKLFYSYNHKKMIIKIDSDLTLTKFPKGIEELIIKMDGCYKLNVSDNLPTTLKILNTNSHTNNNLKKIKLPFGLEILNREPGDPNYYGSDSDSDPVPVSDSDSGSDSE
jgi:hypothetical protein